MSTKSIKEIVLTSYADRIERQPRVQERLWFVGQSVGDGLSCSRLLRAREQYCSGGAVGQDLVDRIKIIDAILYLPFKNMEMGAKGIWEITEEMSSLSMAAGCIIFSGKRAGDTHDWRQSTFFYMISQLGKFCNKYAFAEWKERI